MPFAMLLSGEIGDALHAEKDAEGGAAPPPDAPCSLCQSAAGCCRPLRLVSSVSCHLPVSVCGRARMRRPGLSASVSRVRGRGGGRGGRGAGERRGWVGRRGGVARWGGAGHGGDRPAGAAREERPVRLGRACGNGWGKAPQWASGSELGGVVPTTSTTRLTVQRFAAPDIGTPSIEIRSMLPTVCF